MEEKTRRVSQTDRVLHHLMQRGSITNAQCHDLYGIRHAASIIRNIRKYFRYASSPYVVESVPEKGVNRFGDPCRWVRYTLIKKEADNR